MSNNKLWIAAAILVVVTVTAVLIVLGLAYSGEDPQYMETCGSFPNDKVYVPAAYYEIQSNPPNKAFKGFNVQSEADCLKQCKHSGNCVGYTINDIGNCTFYDKESLGKLTYYCKSGTEVVQNATFAENYRYPRIRALSGHGYFIKDRLGTDIPFIQGPTANEKCLTIPKEEALPIWTNKSYEIPLLSNYTLDNYDTVPTECTTYCSGLGDFSVPGVSQVQIAGDFVNLNVQVITVI